MTNSTNTKILINNIPLYKPKHKINKETFTNMDLQVTITVYVLPYRIVY